MGVGAKCNGSVDVEPGRLGESEDVRIALRRLLESRGQSVPWRNWK
jgi:hypothetical protein